MENFSIELWKRHELRKYNNLTSRRPTFKASSFKNLTATLKDGTTVTIHVDDNEPWTGKKVTLEDGTPLPPGEHTLASSLYSSEQQITVSPNGIITKVVVLENKGIQRLENKIEALKKNLKN